MSHERLHVLGCGSGIAGASMGTADAPACVQQSKYFKAINASCEWLQILQPIEAVAKLRLLERVAQLNQDLAQAVSKALLTEQKLCVLGGDHSCALGTWNGARMALQDRGDLGLIWIDAHMDSHTPETSESGNIHGMPLAALLGYGYPELVRLQANEAVLKPGNVCLVGVRSFEEGEARLLERLNVRVYYMDEVHQRGLDCVMQEAINHVTAETVAFGISLDLDALDPVEVPGVDVPEPGGIHRSDLMAIWKEVLQHPQYLMTEIVEFNPSKDQQQKTERLVVELMECMATC